MIPTPPTLEQTQRFEVEMLAPEDLPNIDNLVTEDDTPVDNLFSAKQQRLLVESLYSSWAGPGEGRPFLADSNVGVFYSVREPPLVPDAFLSLDVRAPADPWPKRNRSYFIWEYGKPPDVVIEVVSNREGKEAGRKKRLYERMGVIYYVIYDPLEQLGPERLQVFELHAGVYVAIDPPWLPEAGLGLQVWHGVYQDMEDDWLRWYDREGNIILTGAERAEQEHQRAEQERQWA
ncbi:MAG: hypothetical protein A2Z04_01095 [Chloroflexi bacterium RBG_16_57_9]|nr:MAG: hypothetical protein A2Z04_01095 [Chloroflexi bacterium RBG_16_57_9]